MNKFKRVRHQLHRVMDCIRTVYFRKTLAAMRCVYNVFERYFDLRYIVISKEYLQPDIGAVPSFFQEVALQWSSFFKGTMFFWNKHLQSSLFLNGVELIRHYSCSHLFVEWPFLYYKRAVSATQIYCDFSGQDLKPRDIIVTNYINSLVLGMYI